MSRTFAIELTKVLDIVERDAQLAHLFIIGVDCFYSREVQHRIQEHRGVTGGKDETVAVRPDATFRIKAQHAVPQRVNDRSHRHRSAWMSGVGLLHGIHTQRADGVHAELVEQFSVQSFSKENAYSTPAD